MRLLKSKIIKAKQFKLNKKTPKIDHNTNQHLSETTVSLEDKQSNNNSPNFPYRVAADSLFAKNIVKNYGKAMSAFAASSNAKPYLDEFAKKNLVSKEHFLEFITTYKESVDSIDSLRALLLIYSDDSFEMASYKRIFRSLCEVFLKYFSVNWIFNGKMHHKIQHLKYRFKMLRRIQNPKLFTYLTSKVK